MKEGAGVRPPAAPAPGAGAGNLHSLGAPGLAILPFPDGRASPHGASDYPLLATNC